MRTQHAGLLLALAVVTGTSGWKPAVLAAAQGGPGSVDRQTLTHNGVSRGYVVRVPEGVARRSERVALVLVLHGGGGNAVNAEAMTGFTDKARQEGFIAVYPEGTSRACSPGTRAIAVAMRCRPAWTMSATSARLSIGS